MSSRAYCSLLFTSMPWLWSGGSLDLRDGTDLIHSTLVISPSVSMYSTTILRPITKYVYCHGYPIVSFSDFILNVLNVRFLGLTSATSLVISCMEDTSLMTGTEGSAEHISVNT